MGQQSSTFYLLELALAGDLRLITLPNSFSHPTRPIGEVIAYPHERRPIPAMQDLSTMTKMESNIRLVDGAGRQHDGKELAGEAAKWGGCYRP
ncbi:hypothetical protein [Bisbaumannia pacifica]|uniref:Uncharacterized protein n=1 Tax=Bisbaumannia pacifica TaxID=77098 RepID=A0ABD4L4H5_9GAMM|nr:hypothetical protein [Halomonas pacifica]MBH8581654.1 hypothetical protein [Halomonas pacifica]